MPAEILLFPVRHHSPACAWHLERLIAERRPRAVLVEGPRDATALIAHLVDPATRAPVAIFTTFVDTANVLGLPRHNPAHPARFAAYYPLADYSPELVAARAGHAAGAEVRFVDLTFPEMVLAERQQNAPPLRSLFDESYFRHSRFLQALCARTGARDADDLWDHLYETDFQSLPAGEFIRRVETYCELSRADYTPETLAAEGHTAREAAMAAEIAAEAARGPGLVLAVTGGFHTPGLRELLKDSARRTTGDAQRATRNAQIPGLAHTLLVRYGFAQLDRLNGYASGMPAPAFYQRLWESLHAAQGDDPAQACAEFVVALGRHLRHATGSGLAAPSAADEIAALDQTRRLAAFRAHPWPAREDLLDGIRSAFVKGDAGTEGALVLAQAQLLLAGDRIGDLPAGVAVAPLVEDFRRTAAQLRLDISSLQLREVTLDLYRSAGHRATSRCCYRLNYLEVPFAERLRGPDFATGQGLAYIHEVWRYHWRPDTESTLAERSVYGSTLEEACTARLQDEMAADEARGLGRSAAVAADRLVNACRMGLQRFVPELLATTAARVAGDPALVSLAHTAERLLLLHLSLEPLEAGDIAGLPALAEQAYQRACYLLPELANTPEQEEQAVIDALAALRQVSLSLGDRAALQAMRVDGLRRLLATSGGNAALRGAAAGMLFGDGALSEDELVRLAGGHMELHGPAFLRGLLRAERACLWQLPALLVELNRVIAGWTGEDFVRRLPELRLAFSSLAARECDEVARAVAELLGLRAAPGVMVAGATEADLLLGAELERRVREVLVRDGLPVSS